VRVILSIESNFQVSAANTVPRDINSKQNC